MELTPGQIYLVGLVAVLLAAAFRLIIAKFSNIEIGKGTMTIIVAIVAFVLALVFQLPEFPAYVDPLQYAAALLVLLGGYVGAATIIYNLIIDKVLDAIGLKVERLAAG